MHRRNLNDLTQADRKDLSKLIQDYVTPAVVQDHVQNGHLIPANFLSWHRNYLMGLENYLQAKGHTKFVPLPAWDPSTQIPEEFNVPNRGPDRLEELNPNVSFENIVANLDNFENEEELMDAIEGRHDDVHNRIRGVMQTLRSPLAPIFWCWHSFVDDIWWEWQRRQLTVPDCIGLTLSRARRLITGMGLAVGSITTQSHSHLSFEQIRRPLNPFRTTLDSPFEIPFPMSPQLPDNLLRHRHVIVDQFPEPGDHIRRGDVINLVLGKLP